MFIFLNLDINYIIILLFWLNCKYIWRFCLKRVSQITINIFIQNTAFFIEFCVLIIFKCILFFNILTWLTSLKYYIATNILIIIMELKNRFINSELFVLINWIWEAFSNLFSFYILLQKCLWIAFFFNFIFYFNNKPFF